MIRSHRSNAALALGAALALPLAACTNDSELLLAEMTRTEITPSGGTARSADERMTLVFSLGSLTQATNIEIETVRGKAIPGLRSGAAYDLRPHGLSFNRPVSITFTSITALAEGEELAIANVDGPYPEVLESSIWDAGTGMVTATLEHFSSYAVVVVYNPCRNKSCGDACTICDPLDTTCTEPAPANKACNRSGLCIDETIPVCEPERDAGIEDSGQGDSGQEDAGDDAGIAADAGTSSCAQTFMQNIQPVVDILIVMDDSASMSEEQTNMAADFGLLYDTLVQNSVDFHIGVTTTDVDAWMGLLQGTPAVLSTTTPNLAQAFADNVNRGINGSGFEQGLEAAHQALMNPGNAGFLRDHSSLTVIYVSDEQDQSSSSTTAYANFLLGLRGPRRVQANAIAGPELGCSGPNGFADSGSRYLDVRNATGGAFDTICNVPWNNALTDLGGFGFGFLYQFQLTTPAPSVTVTVENVVAAPTDYSYDPVSGIVEFTEEAVPPAGASIVITPSGC